MSVFVGYLRGILIRGPVSRGFHSASLSAIRCVFPSTLSDQPLSGDTFSRAQNSGIAVSFIGLSAAWRQCSRFCSSDSSDNHVTSPESETESLDEFLETLDGEKSSWWSLYVRGKVPDYPPRREMFETLTAEGVDAERMEAYEIEDFTRWLLMRKKYGEGYPKMPYDVTLEQKISELKRRIPLSRVSDTRESSMDDDN